MHSSVAWATPFSEELVKVLAEVQKEYAPVRTIWVKPRKSKLGDYRPEYGSRKNFEITLNNHLPIYVALLVWIHEFAHHVNWLHFRDKVAPHGKEWKYYFKKIYLESFQPFFSDEWQKALAIYFKNPSAATFSHSALQQFYKTKQEELNPNLPKLGLLPNGTKFVFKNRVFQKEKPLRTFVLCNEIATGRKYRIRASCSVALQQS